MLEKIMNNIKIQTYTIILSIPPIATLGDGIYKLTKDLSVSNGLESITGIFLLSFARAIYTRQRERYKKLTKKYRDKGIKTNIFESYAKSTVCERRVAEVILKEKQEYEYWKKLKEKYPYFQVAIKQIGIKKRM